MANLRKVFHYSSACGLRKRAIGIENAGYAIEFERHGGFGDSIAVSRSSILFIEREGSKVLRADRSRCDAEQAA